MIYHTDWTKADGQPKLRFFVTDAEGYRLPPVLTDLPIRPYFFAKQEAIAPIRQLLANTLIEDAGNGLVKVAPETPDRVVDIRGIVGIENTMEADVPYGRRVMVDFGLSCSVPKKILYFDLECDPSKGFPNEETAEARILSIGTTDSDGNEMFFCEDDERALLAKFFLYADRYPVWCGFYSSHFDWPYLQNRCQRLGIEFWFDRFVHVDLLAMYKFLILKRQDEYSLAHLSRVEELGIEKVQIEIPRLLEYFEKDRETLREYNLADVRINRALDEKLHMTQILFTIASMCHVNVKDMVRMHKKNAKEYNTSVPIDGLVLRLSGLRTPRIIWPTRYIKCPRCGGQMEESQTEDDEILRTCKRCDFEYRPKDQEKYKGALVITPVPGVHRNVVMLDANALYPTIIRAVNVGPETYRADGSGDIKSPIGRGSFVSQPQSIFSEALESLSTIRGEYKKHMQALIPDTVDYKAAYAQDYSIKTLMNSFYGVVGGDFSRYYNVDVAENITLTGQLVTRFMKDYLENRGMIIIMGDTDSVAFVAPEATPEFAEKVASDLTVAVVQMLKEKSGIETTLFSLEVQRICQSFFIPQSTTREGGTKKRYAALVTWETKPRLYILVKGFEAVRHDSSQAQKDFQNQGLLLRLNESTLEDQKMFLEHWWTLLHSGELNDKIVQRRGLGKEPGEYKTKNPALTVGLRLQAEGKLVLHRGDKIAYIKVGPKPEQVIPAFPGMPIELTEEQLRFVWDKQFVNIALRLDLPAETKTVRKVRRVKSAP